MIRRASPNDLQAIIKLGLEALEMSNDGDLIIDAEKVRQSALTAVTSPAHFAWVSENNNQIFGALLAESTPMIFHKRQQACVTQFYCKLPGDGRRLVKQLIEWYEQRPILRAITFTLEHECDPRIILLLKRMGFTQQFPVLMRTKNVKSR